MNSSGTERVMVQLAGHNNNNHGAQLTASMLCVCACDSIVCWPLNHHQAAAAATAIIWRRPEVPSGPSATKLSLSLSLDSSQVQVAFIKSETAALSGRSLARH